MQQEVGIRVRDEGPRTNALTPRFGDLEKGKQDFYFLRKIHCEDDIETWDGGMKICVYSDGTRLQEAMWQCCCTRIGKPF